MRLVQKIRMAASTILRRCRRAGAVQWGFPKGTVEEGASVRDHAACELREETGLSTDGDELPSFPCVSTVKKGRRGNVPCHIFLYRYDGDAPLAPVGK